MLHSRLYIAGEVEVEGAGTHDAELGENGGVVRGSSITLPRERAVLSSVEVTALSALRVVAEHADLAAQQGRTEAELQGPP